MKQKKVATPETNSAVGDNISSFKPKLSVTKTSSALRKAASGFNMTSESPIALPSGKYQIGDPHHAVGLELHEFLEMTQAKADARDVYFPDDAKLDGKVGWYQFTGYDGDEGCYQVQTNTLPNVHVSGNGYFKSPLMIGILPLDLTIDSVANYASGITVTFPEEVTFTYEHGRLRFKSGEGELVIDSIECRYIALGVDLSHLTPDEQAARRLYMIDQVARYAHGVPGGYVGPAYMMNGYLQITVHSWKDPYLVFPDFLSKIESGEIDIPEDNNEALVFQYALISFIDFDDPIYCLKAMSGDGKHFAMIDEKNRSSSESVAASLEKDAELFEARAKELEDSLDISTSNSGQVDRNKYIYSQCGVVLARIRAKRLKAIAKQAASRANQQE